MTSVCFLLGWYVARGYALYSCVVLIALLTETTVLYGRLTANALLLLRRERADRLTAAMDHELKQPLAAMRSFGAAAT